MNTFTIKPNSYLKHSVPGFFHYKYLGMNRPGNPDFINRLKNDNHSRGINELMQDAEMVCDVLCKDLPNVVIQECLNRPVVCVMPRAKQNSKYTDAQLLFLGAVSNAVEIMSGMKNGTQWITRMKPTQTTHLRYSYSFRDKGILPYEGITKDTCIISPKVKGRDIILVDDVYTIDVNVIEDMLQALLDAGANNVVSYVVSKTNRCH